MPLAHNLVELRKKAKLTQSELGEKLSISAQAISKWENGISEPDISTLRKLADIYGVSLSYILEGEDVNKSENNSTFSQEETPQKSVFDSLCDVYLTEINEKIVTIQYLRNMLGIDLANAYNAVKNLPYCITGKVDEETATNIVNYFSNCGAKVAVEKCSGMNDRKDIVSLEIPAPPKKTHDMRNRFILANVTAIIPAIVVLVFCLMMGGGIDDVLLSIYTALSIYSLIFLLWYPTLTRKLLYPIRALRFEGFFGFIGSFILLIILLPWLIIVGLISPIIYAFSIKTRVERMLDDDSDDDIFLDEIFRSDS